MFMCVLLKLMKYIRILIIPLASSNSSWTTQTAQLQDRDRVILILPFKQCSLFFEDRTVCEM
jgi:hypothetical protein